MRTPGQREREEGGGQKEKKTNEKCIRNVIESSEGNDYESHKIYISNGDGLKNDSPLSPPLQLKLDRNFFFVLGNKIYKQNGQIILKLNEKMFVIYFGLLLYTLQSLLLDSVK